MSPERRWFRATQKAPGTCRRGFIICPLRLSIKFLKKSCWFIANPTLLPQGKFVVETGELEEGMCWYYSQSKEPHLHLHRWLGFRWQHSSRGPGLSWISWCAPQRHVLINFQRHGRLLFLWPICANQTREFLVTYVMSKAFLVIISL